MNIIGADIVICYLKNCPSNIKDQKMMTNLLEKTGRSAHSPEAVTKT